MGRAKLENVMLSSKSSRRECFNKRCRGAFKKVYELARICGAGVHVTIEGEDGNIYDFHRRLNPNLLPSAVQNDIEYSATAPAPIFGAPAASLSHNIDEDIGYSGLMSHNITHHLPLPSSRSSSKPTSRYMFYNGGRTMLDSGIPVTPELRRRLLLDSDNCNCFDCNKGYSNGLFETITMDHSLPPLYEDDRPYYQKILFMGDVSLDRYMQHVIQHDSISITSQSEGIGGFNAMAPTYDEHDAKGSYRENSLQPAYCQARELSNTESHNATPSTCHFHLFQDQNSMLSTHQFHDLSDIRSHNNMLSTRQFRKFRNQVLSTYEHCEVKDVNQDGTLSLIDDHDLRVLKYDTSMQQVGNETLTLPAMSYQAPDHVMTTAIMPQENSLLMENYKQLPVVDFVDHNGDHTDDMCTLPNDPVDELYPLPDCFCGRENCEDLLCCFTKGWGYDGISGATNDSDPAHGCQ
ncbi:hypothetical protein L7F22_000762 [Adiantum nelumboides]|nr:hypothetical protein [Adiantum nelumboides]